MMGTTLGLFFFIIALLTDSTKAADEKVSDDEQHGNHSFIQPRQSSFLVNLDARSIETATIQTPRFPIKYPSKIKVDWGVQATGTLELFCPVFKLRPRNRKGKCIDYLEVECEYDGYVSIYKYCGNDLNEDGFTIETNPPSRIQCKFTFKSSRNKRYIGFNCTLSSPDISDCPVYSPPDILDCNCGVSTPLARDDKIVGGSTAEKNEFPWQAAMVWYGTFNKNSLVCGGSLINDQWVLTAAHCTIILSGPSEIQILLGLWCWNTTCGMYRYDVVEIIQHFEYDDATYNSDISLLKLKKPIDFINTPIRPVCLPITKTDPIPDEDDVEATISGFGNIVSGGNLPKCLQWAEVHTMNNTVCQAKYHNEDITDNMICAAAAGIDSCQGDSGGPMTTNATCNIFGDYAVQIGVVSWGYGCADPRYPGVYARVTEYISWINDNTAGSSTCPPPC